MAVLNKCTLFTKSNTTEEAPSHTFKKGQKY